MAHADAPTDVVSPSSLRIFLCSSRDAPLRTRRDIALEPKLSEPGCFRCTAGPPRGERWPAARAQRRDGVLTPSLRPGPFSSEPASLSTASRPRSLRSSKVSRSSDGAAQEPTDAISLPADVYANDPKNPFGKTAKPAAH